MSTVVTSSDNFLRNLFILVDNKDGPTQHHQRAFSERNSAPTSERLPATDQDLYMNLHEATVGGHQASIENRRNKPTHSKLDLHPDEPDGPKENRRNEHEYCETAEKREGHGDVHAHECLPSTSLQVGRKFTIARDDNLELDIDQKDHANLKDWTTSTEYQSSRMTQDGNLIEEQSDKSGTTSDNTYVTMIYQTSQYGQKNSQTLPRSSQFEQNTNTLPSTSGSTVNEKALLPCSDPLMLGDRRKTTCSAINRLEKTANPRKDIPKLQNFPIKPRIPTDSVTLENQPNESLYADMSVGMLSEKQRYNLTPRKKIS